MISKTNKMNQSKILFLILFSSISLHPKNSYIFENYGRFIWKNLWLKEIFNLKLKFLQRNKNKYLIENIWKDRWKRNYRVLFF